MFNNLLFFSTPLLHFERGVDPGNEVGVKLPWWKRVWSGKKWNLTIFLGISRFYFMGLIFSFTRVWEVWPVVQGYWPKLARRCLSYTRSRKVAVQIYVSYIKSEMKRYILKMTFKLVNPRIWKVEYDFSLTVNVKSHLRLVKLIDQYCCDGWMSTVCQWWLVSSSFQWAYKWSLG